MVHTYYMESRVLVFDFDGVLADTLPTAREFTKWMYPGLTDADYYAISLQNFYTGIKDFSHLRRDMSDSELARAFEGYFEQVTCSSIYTGVMEFLDAIPSHISCVINSSAQSSACIPILEKHNIIDRFSDIYTRDIADSKVEKFHMIAQKYNISLDEMIFVTDSVGDIHEARQIGVPTIAVGWGLHEMSDLFDAGVSAIAHTFDDLNRWIHEFFDHTHK